MQIQPPTIQTKNAMLEDKRRNPRSSKPTTTKINTRARRDGHTLPDIAKKAIKQAPLRQL
jgi:hypothetical protein